MKTIHRAETEKPYLDNIGNTARDSSRVSHFSHRTYYYVEHYQDPFMDMDLATGLMKLDAYRNLGEN